MGDFGFYVLQGVASVSSPSYRGGRGEPLWSKELVAVCGSPELLIPLCATVACAS